MLYISLQISTETRQQNEIHVLLMKCAFSFATMYSYINSSLCSLLELSQLAALAENKIKVTRNPKFLLVG